VVIVYEEKKGKSLSKGTTIPVKQSGTVRRHGIGGISWEQEGERVLVDIFSQFVQDLFEVGSDIDSSFFEGA
jgi:hypothetical protein